jgi:hypothetical protein
MLAIFLAGTKALLDSLLEQESGPRDVENGKDRAVVQIIKNAAHEDFQGQPIEQPNPLEQDRFKGIQGK